jgi:hypothetical protein
MLHNEFDRYYVKRSQELKELNDHYSAYLEKIKKLKRFQLIHQPPYSMHIDDYISIKFFQRLYQSNDKKEYLELFALLAELSEFIPQDKNTLLYGPLHTIFKSAFTLADKLSQMQIKNKNLLITLNTSIKKTLAYIKDPIPGNASQLFSAANTMADTMAPDGTTAQNIKVICITTFTLVFFVGLVALIVVNPTPDIILNSICIVLSAPFGLGLMAFSNYNNLMYDSYDLKNAQHKISNNTLFQAVRAATNQQSLFVTNENQQARLSTFNELISTKKNQTQETAEKKIRQMHEDYTALERDIKLLKEFQIKHYPRDTNLTHYLSSITAFKIIQNDANQEYFNENTHKRIMTLIKSLGELSQNIDQVDPSIQLSLNVTLYNAIKLSGELIKNMQIKSSDKISSLRDVIRKANAFALDHHNSNHRSQLINATNKMINKICDPICTYPENRSRLQLVLAAGVCAATATLATASLMPMSPVVMLLAIGGVSTLITSLAWCITLNEHEDKPEDTFAYNVGRQLDLISKPFLFFSKRDDSRRVVENGDGHILLSSLAHPYHI